MLDTPHCVNAIFNALQFIIYIRVIQSFIPSAKFLNKTCTIIFDRN